MELADYYATLEDQQGLKFDIREYCFKEQIAFIEDPSPFKTAVCSRRSGKTVSCAADLVDTALKFPNRVCLYITLSRLNAKRIIWSEILEINRAYNLGGKPNESELSLKFPNKSVIYLTGAGDRSQIENFRGMAITKCYLDETQSFRPYIEQLIDDVISKALFDYNGTLCLIGTPGPVPSGYFYDCAQSPQWSHHSWTMFENPHLQLKSGKTPQELLERELKRKGITVENATIQRECFAKWVVDLEALVFRYDGIANHYDVLPALDGTWEYIIGVDLGYDDADAIAVIGWHPRIKQSYLIEEDVHRKQGITELATKLERLIKQYDPLRVVMDTGGLGKKIAEEIQRRYSLPIKAADKARKFEHIELLNDAMRTKRFYAKKDSRFAQDCALLEWDEDSVGDKLKVSDRFHSDINDAVLYSWIEALHWLHEPGPPKIARGSPAWMKEQEDRMEAVAIEALEHKNENDIWGDAGNYE
jgi:hypothetical protein